MPNKHGRCSCCCDNSPMFTDPFNEVKDDWHYWPDAIFEVDSGHLQLIPFSPTPEGAYYREVSITRTKNLLVSVSAQVFDNDDNDALRVGIYIGGVASIYWEDVAGNFRIKCAVGCDNHGNGGTVVQDMGFGGFSTRNLSINVQSEWTDTDHFYITFTSGSNSWCYEIDLTLVSPLAIGVMGGGEWDNFSIIRTYNSNICGACGVLKNDYVTQFVLSVPPIANGGCDCEQLSDQDFTLTFKQVLNSRSCIYQTSCGWVTEGITGHCSEDDVCPDGWLWFMSNGVLEATTGVNILKYCCTDPIEEYGDPLASHVFTYCCGVCTDTCEGYPATLTVVPL